MNLKILNHLITFEDDLELMEWLRENIVGRGVQVSLIIHIPVEGDPK